MVEREKEQEKARATDVNTVDEIQRALESDHGGARRSKRSTNENSQGVRGRTSGCGLNLMWQRFLGFGSTKEKRRQANNHPRRKTVASKWPRQTGIHPHARPTIQRGLFRSVQVGRHRPGATKKPQDEVGGGEIGDPSPHPERERDSACLSTWRVEPARFMGDGSRSS
ncbi:hypothetical protein BKA80DRAFT_11856 [Phyllosticta citrichinensis]